MTNASARSNVRTRQGVARRLVWRAQWMRDLGDEIADVPLNELAIPGTHDMGTYQEGGVLDLKAP
jgi:hypothetical protein